MEYLTVQGVAKYLKLSPMMVYKLAQRGEIPAKKIGRVWRFARDAIDDWMHEGGERGHLARRDPLVDTILSDFSRRLRTEFGKRLQRVILFGSHARGEATPDSDIDVAVILDQVAPADEARISDIAYAVTYGRDRLKLLSTIKRSAAEYRAGASPLLMNIAREGQVLQ